jgi:DNA-binding PadR family transcriptional regulator
MPRMKPPSFETSGTMDDSHFRSHTAPRGLLHFYALLSIAKKPMSGYDLMKEIEFKTEGAWRPGPGAVYPVLRKLVKEGYITVRKRSASGPAQIPYEITPGGRRGLADAKKAMGSSSQRLRTMSSLFLDLMEPDDLIRFVLNSFDVQTGLVRVIVESKKGGLGEEDKLFVLRQYRLNLERELSRATHLIEQIESGQPKKASAKES